MFAKLINNSLKLAPHFVEVEGKIILNPQENDYRLLGYKPVVYQDCPSTLSNQTLVETYSEDNEKIYVNYQVQSNSNISREEEIKIELMEIDSKSIRPLRAQETDRLIALENQAELLRAELRDITGSSN